MCPLLEFGSAEGLAYQHNFQQDIQNQFEQERLNRQARQDAENRAKLFGDMFQFGEATTTYNKQKLKEFSENQIRDIGTYINTNPDWQTNGGKFANVKNMSHKLLDNDWVKNDMAATSEYQNLVKFIHDNPGAEQLPEIQQQLTKWDNYRKTGDSDGRMDLPETAKQRFMFNNPASTFDVHKAAEEAFSGLNYSDSQVLPGTKSIGYRLSVSDDAKQRAVANMLTGYGGLKWKATWNSMSPNEKKMFATKASPDGDITQWIVNMGRDYVKPDKIVPGQNYRPQAGINGQGISSLEELFRTAQNQPNVPIQTSPDAITHTYGNKDGMFNFNDATLIVGGNLDGTGMEKTIPGGLGMLQAKPTGNVIHIKDPTNANDPGKRVAEFEVMMPLRPFIDRMGKVPVDDHGNTALDAIDYNGVLGGVTNSIFNSADNTTGFTIHHGDGWDKDYTKAFEKIDVGDPRNSGQVPLIKFTVHKPLGFDESLAANFNRAVGITNPKGQDEPSGSEDESSSDVKIGVDEATGQHYLVTSEGQFAITPQQAQAALKK